LRDGVVVERTPVSRRISRLVVYGVHQGLKIAGDDDGKRRLQLCKRPKNNHLLDEPVLAREDVLVY